MSALTRTLASRFILQQIRMASSHRGRRTDPGPIQQAITQKAGPCPLTDCECSRLTGNVFQLTDTLRPSFIDVKNDSHLHACVVSPRISTLLTRSRMPRGHAAMRAANASGGETHFSVEIVSGEFEGKVRSKAVSARSPAEID